MDKEALLFSLLTQGGDTSWLIPYLMMSREGGGSLDDIMGLMFMKSAMSQPAPQPISWREGDFAFIAEGGVLYKINTATMKVEAKLPYRQGMDNPALKAILEPMMGEARVRAQQSSCLSNLKQLCLAFLMYAQDWDERLPTKTWVKDILPYTGNAQILVCPSRPDQKIGYAFNEALVGVNLKKIDRPSETVLLIEANLKDDNPLGSAKDIPEGGVHDGGVNLGFADGHCKWVSVLEAKEILQRAKP
jgi:prepilin-type processing-associated H-X9-DG protein